MTDPKTDVAARLREVRAEIDILLDGGQAREEDGHTAGTLEEIDGVVFGLNGRDTDLRVTQEPVEEPPPPALVLLAYHIQGIAGGYDRPMTEVASAAISTMEELKRQDEYGRHFERERG